MDSLVWSVAAQLFGLPAPLLAFDASGLRGRRGPRGPALLRFVQRRRDDRSKAFRHRLTIAQLTALRLRREMQHALLIDYILEFRQQALVRLDLSQFSRR